MTLQFIRSSNSISVNGANTSAFQLAQGDELVVGVDGSLVATGTGSSSAILASGSYQILIAGFVYSANAWGINGSAGSGRITISSTGIARAGIQGGNSEDVIINHGILAGIVSLGNGADVFDNRFGLADNSISIALGAGDDVAYGGRSNESFEGGAGDDFVNGGDGEDTLVFDTPDGITIDLRETGPQNTGLGFDTFINIENVTGGFGNDRIVGNAGDNVLQGSGGNDTLEGGLGNDRLIGGNNAGDNVTASYTGSAGAVVSLALQAQPQDTKGYGVDILIDVDNLSGGSGNDVFTGDGNANIISGNGGNDTLISSGGADMLDGGAGIDTAVFSGHPAVTVDLRRGVASIEGSPNTIVSGIENLRGGSGMDSFTGSVIANTIFGNGGNDTLNGSSGKDVLVGGTGQDIFVFDTALGARTNLDRLVDFLPVDDAIWLDNAVFRALTQTGTLSRSAFHIGAAAHDRDDRIVYNKATGALYYDADGTGKTAAVQFAALAKDLIISSRDFVVI